MASRQKTAPTSADVKDFVDSVEPTSKQADSRELMTMMSDATKKPAAMWGASMIGFGSYQYRYDSGHAGTAMVVGFSPRKSALSIYVLNDFDGQAELLDKLGKHKAGKGCLYVKTLDDIDRGVLREIIERSVAQTSTLWPEQTDSHEASKP